MRSLISLPTLLVLAAALSAPSEARDHRRRRPPGERVSVSVDVAGRKATLYPDPGGSGRWYLEAREGSPYTVNLRNRTGERLGVAVSVDGLNVISGELAAARPRRRPGRMYILEPWQHLSIRGWRTSLSEVRRFTFVNEATSYAARSGKANSKLGWIEVAVYRERRSHDSAKRVGRLSESDELEKGEPSATRPAVPPRGGGSEDRATAEAPQEGVARQEARERKAARALGEARRDSYPGTGWGSPTRDRAIVVDFDPERHAAEQLTLRYEYRETLHTLGILPPPRPGRHRLWERERGDSGFARPPDW